MHLKIKVILIPSPYYLRIYSVLKFAAPVACWFMPVGDRGESEKLIEKEFP
jgi:hypothetical protein